jgi:hypothetical protein
VRRDLLLLGTLVGGCLVVLSRGAGSPPLLPDANDSARVAPPARAPEPQPVLQRNPFEFVGVPRAPVPTPPAAATSGLSPAPDNPPPPPPVRLVGFVMQAGRTRAAIAIEDETFLLADGEVAAGYTLLSTDESSGVRLRTPDGAELSLAMPE